MIEAIKQLQKSAGYDQLIAYLSNELAQMKSESVSDKNMTDAQIAREVRAKELAIKKLEEIFSVLDMDFSRVESSTPLSEYEVFPGVDNS